MDQVNAVAPTYQVSKVSAISVRFQFSMLPQLQYLQNVQMHHSAGNAEHEWTYKRHAYILAAACSDQVYESKEKHTFAAVTCLARVL